MIAERETIQTQQTPAQSAQRPALPMFAALATIRAIAADKSLPAAVARVVVAIVCQADSATGTAWASYGQLRRDYGFSADTIARAIRSELDASGDSDKGLAIGKYLAPVRRGARGAIQFSILPTTPATGAQEDENAVQRTGHRSAQSASERTDSRSAELPALRPCGFSAPATGVILMSYSGEEEETPPTPPAGGVCAFSPEPVEPATGNQEPGASPPQTAMPATEQQAVEHVSAAMVQATGHGLSWLEKRRVRREFSGGAGAMLIASITADIVRGARAAMPKNRTFGIGWIIKHAQDVSAKRTAARAVQAAQEQARLSAIAGGREIVADIDAQARQREADAARNLAYFQTLPTDRQEHYRRRAMAAPFAPRTRPDVIEASAAAFAWRDKP